MLVSIFWRLLLYVTLGGMAWCVTSPHLVGRMTYRLLAELKHLVSQKMKGSSTSRLNTDPDASVALLGTSRKG